MKTGVGNKALHQRVSRQLHDKAGNAKRFDRFVQTNFGVSSSPAVESLRKDVRAGDWRWLPSVQQGQTQGFNGAFVGGGSSGGGGGGGVVPAGGPPAGSKILLNNGLDPNQKTATFWEEVGHAMDSRLRGGQSDAPGDEGQMLAQQLLGKDVLPSTRTENDHGTVSVDGHPGLSAEFGIPEKAKLLQQTIASPETAPDGIYQFTNFAPANRLGAAPRINSNPIAENKYIADVARASGMPVATIPIGGNPDNVKVFLTTSNGHRMQVLADPNLPGPTVARFKSFDSSIRINSRMLDEFQELRNSLYGNIQDPFEQQRFEHQYPVKFQALDEFARGSIAGNLVHEMSHAEQWQASLQFANYDQRLAETHYNSWLNTQEYAAHAAQYKFVDAWYAAKELTLDAGGVNLNSYPRTMTNLLAPIETFNLYYSKGYDVERARLAQLTGVPEYGLTGQQITDTVTTTMGPSVNREGIPVQSAVGQRAGSNAFSPDELSPDAQPAAAGSTDPAYADPVSRTQELGEFDRLLRDRLHPPSGQALHEQHVIEVKRIIAGGEAAGASSTDIGIAVDSSTKAFATKIAEHIQGAASEAGEALKAVAPLLDVATLGYSIYQDINRGDGYPTETAKATTGLASAWAGAELGAQIGAVAGPVGAAIGGFVGGVGGYATGSGLTGWVESKMGWEAADTAAPVTHATLTPHYDLGYPPRAAGDLVIGGQPIAAMQDEASRLAGELRTYVDQGDGTEVNFTQWWNDNFAGQDARKAERVFSAMFMQVPDFGYWIGAKHDRVFEAPIANYLQWGMTHALDGGTGTGNIVNAIKKFTEDRQTREIDLAQQSWFGTLPENVKENFYNKAATLYSPTDWYAAQGQLVDAIAQQTGAREQAYLSARTGAPA